MQICFLIVSKWLLLLQATLYPIIMIIKEEEKRGRKITLCISVFISEKKNFSRNTKAPRCFLASHWSEFSHLLAYDFKGGWKSEHLWFFSWDCGNGLTLQGKELATALQVGKMKKSLHIRSANLIFLAIFTSWHCSGPSQYTEGRQRKSTEKKISLINLSNCNSSLMVQTLSVTLWGAWRRMANLCPHCWVDAVSDGNL